MLLGPTFFVGVRIFDVICALVCVTESRSRYPNYNSGKFYCCDPVNGSERSTSLDEEILTIVRQARGHGVAPQ